MNLTLGPSLPVLAPPPGATSDLAHPNSWASLSVGVFGTTIIVTIIGVAIRVFTKLQIMNQFCHEDYILLLATGWSLAFNAVFLLPVERGFEHVWERPLSSLSPFFYNVYLATIFGALAILFAKWAVLLQIQRVFSARRFTAVWWTVKAIIVTSTLFYIIVIFIYIFLCTPRAKIWDPMLPGNCLDRAADEIYIPTAAVNIALNVGILLVPVMGLRKLQVNLRQKLIIGMMFSANLLSLVCAVGRAISSTKLLTSTDRTRTAAPYAYWASAEITFFLFSAIFPSMPRFWQWLRHRDTSQQQRATPPLITQLKHPTTNSRVAHSAIAYKPSDANTTESVAPICQQGSRGVEAGEISRTVDVDIKYAAIV